MKGSNSKQGKSANLRLVLNLIATSHPISRVDIARSTSLTKQTISNLVETLTDAELIVETGIRREGIGKPSKLLELNPVGAYSLGVRVRAHIVEVGLYNLGGETVHMQTFPIERVEPSTLAVALESMSEQVILEASIDRSKLLGLGLVLPSPQEFSAEHESLLTDKTIARIREELSARVALPVVIESVAGAVSASEMLYGAAKVLQSFVYIHLGESIEVGVVFNRQLLRGYNGINGRLGHVVVIPDGLPCHCGNRGCLDQYASLGSLSKKLSKKTQFKKIMGRDDWLDLICDEEKLSKDLDDWFESMSEPMRIAFNLLENLLNAETVILGGDVPIWFIDNFIRKLRPFIPSVAQFGERELPRFIRTPSLQNMALKGAAILPIHAAISGDHCGVIDLSKLPESTELQQLVYA